MDSARRPRDEASLTIPSARGSNSNKPVARREGLAVEELDGELLIYDLDRDKAHCLNGAAALVWQNCDGVRTIEDLGRLVAPAADVESRGEMVRNALAQLSRRNLLTEKFSDPAGISRRDLVRKVAIAGALGLSIPLVKSIVAPTAAQAATCLPSGTICTSSVQCCSLACVVGVCL